MIECIANTRKAEVQLLLYCARTEINPAMAESIQNLVQQQLDWEYLIKIAHQHGILPLFYHNLQKNCSNLVPSNVLSDLRSRSQEVACYNLSLARELLAIVKLCKSQQIPVLPYKGSVLATLLYGNLTLRSSSDLDIVVLQIGRAHV